MDEEVDDWTLSEDSEDERDLEIALYSQVHFDPVPEVSGNCHKSDCSVNLGNPQFCVGIEEISLPVKMSNKENLSFDNDCMIISNDKDEMVDKNKNSVKNMIYVTSSDEDDHVEFVLSEEQQSKNLKHQYENFGSNNQLLPEKCVNKDRHVETTSTAIEDALIICEDIDDFNDDYEDENDDLLIIESCSQLEGSLPLSKAKEKPSVRSDQAVNQGNSGEREDIICADEIVESETEPLGECLHKSEENAAEPVAFLPFSITKPSFNLQKDVMSEGSDSDDEHKSHTIQPKVINDRPFIMTSKNANFLKVSEGKKLDRLDLKFEKKKKLSKQEAAVLPRKPPVLIRKPPVVKVSYAQDSDTNTDYSDSDIDSKSVKAHSDRRKHSASIRSAKRTRVKLIKENSSSSSSKTGSRIKVQRQTDKKRRHSKVEEDRSSSDNNEMENEKPTRNDSDTDSSICSHGMDAAHNPALDFNIEGGVEGLLKCSKQDEEEKWQISDQDRYQILLTKSRYFSPLSFTCRNCNKEGHKAADCPQPKKSLCILCGELGHAHFSCPRALCFNCNEPGHQRKDCRVPFRGRRFICNRCWMPGHIEEICPDQWRQYHLTCVADNRKIVTAPEEHRNPKVYCYNCGEKGHLGYECKEVLMNRYIFPNYPFIAFYNEGGSKKEERKIECKRRKKLLRKEREERNKEHKKRKHQTEQSQRTFSKGKDGASRTANHNAKFTEGKRDRVSQKEKNKKPRQMKNEETGKEHKKQSRNEERHYSDRSRIVTGTTVFSFQDNINTDCQERDYSFSTKRKCFPERDDKDLWHHRSHRSSNTSYQYHESQLHHEMNSEYDYGMSHQVFHNEWWNEESYSFDKKQWKRKTSRKNSTSRWDHNDSIKRTERQHDPAMHNSRKKRKTNLERIQNLQISFHGNSNRQYHSASRREVVDSHGQHSSYFRSSNKGHSKKESKSGFQMNAHFHSLSTTFKKKGKEKHLL